MTLVPPTDRRARWLTRVERWTEWPLTILAGAFVLVLLAPHFFPLSAEQRNTLVGVDYLIWGIFAADLVVKVAIAPDRVRYLRRHWFDVLLVILPMLRPLRALRILRALVAGARAFQGARRLLRRRGFGYVLLVALGVVVLAAALVHLAERDAAGASISSFPDALWWAATTVTTVGYGDTYPVTAMGRGVAVALIMLGIALFGLLTANLAALFVEEQEDQVVAQLRRI